MEVKLTLFIYIHIKHPKVAPVIKFFFKFLSGFLINKIIL